MWILVDFILDWIHNIGSPMPCCYVCQTFNPLFSSWDFHGSKTDFQASPHNHWHIRCSCRRRLDYRFIVQCLPVSCFWVGQAYLAAGLKLSSPSFLHGWCMPQVLHLAVPLFAGLASGVTIPILPATGLWNLQLAREEEFGV